MRKFTILFALLLIITLAVPAVSPQQKLVQAQEPVTLRMGLLPILDVLPFYVAQEAGYFEAEGVNIELVPVSSAMERDQLMLSGEIDGMLNDLISTGIFNQDEPFIVIVAQARRAYEGHPQFRILAAPRSNITLPSEAANFDIGISENSVIHYITQRIMEHEGVNSDDLHYVIEPNIPVRFQLLMEGSMKAVTLPDPMGQAAVDGGAILVADDTALADTEFSQSVLTFRKTVVDEHPEAVQAFLRAWMQAADDINADPEAYRDLWLENTNVPDNVRDTYELPPFPTYRITQEDAWNDAMQWMVDQDIIDEVPDYEGSVDPTFIEAITPLEAEATATPEAE
jgi:NitT/TauT family transport system substrate-binding protein